MVDRCRSQRGMFLRTVFPVDSQDPCWQALSDLFKSITALSADATLISLPPGPLLELVCRAAQRQLTAVWLALANMLIIQLDPPATYTVSLRAVPSHEVLTVVRDVVGVLLQATLDTLGIEGGMEAVRGGTFVIGLEMVTHGTTQNPDIVQDFFNFVEKVKKVSRSGSRW
jgi:hypothetical protein